MSLKCTTDTQDIDELSGPGAAGAFCLPPGCTNVIIPSEPWKEKVKKHGSKPNPVPFERCTTFLLSLQLTVTLWLSSGSWKVRESLLRVSWECLFLLIKRTEMRGKLSSNVFPLPSYLEQEHNVWHCSNHPSCYHEATRLEDKRPAAKWSRAQRWQEPGTWLHCWTSEPRYLSFYQRG